MSVVASSLALVLALVSISYGYRVMSDAASLNNSPSPQVSYIASNR